MTIRKFEIFYEVAKELNMTKAAKKLYISQSAISQAILEMENILGIKLFNRIGKKLHLTNEGKLFLNYVRRILNIYNESVQVVKDINKLEKGVLKIGASTTIGIYVMPKIIKNFLKIHKNIDISIKIENTQNISEMILENKIDLAFVEGPVHFEEIIVENFWEDELVFIAPSLKKWNNIRYIGPSQLEGEKIIMRESGSGTREIFDNAMVRSNIKYNIAFELGNTEAIKKAVESGMGISCLSKRTIKDEIRYGKLLSFRLKALRIKRYFKLIYHKDKYKSKLFQNFVEFAKNN